MKQSVTVGAQLLWGGRYGCNNGRYGCTIVMPYIEINESVSQWLLTFNLCVSVTWPLTCAFHIPCTHTPEIIYMHRGVCDKDNGLSPCQHQIIIWTNAGILLIGPSETAFSEILIEIETFEITECLVCSINTTHMMTSSNGNISALLAHCTGNSPVTDKFLSQRPVSQSFPFLLWSAPEHAVE